MRARTLNTCSFEILKDPLKSARVPFCVWVKFNIPLGGTNMQWALEIECCKAAATLCQCTVKIAFVAHPLTGDATAEKSQEKICKKFHMLNFS